jgi:hypothetical protein
VRPLHQVVQGTHFRAQQVETFSPDLHLMSRNPAVKPIAGPAPRPFVLHDRGKLCSTSVAAGMKCDTSELGTQGVVASFKPDLFLLIMQLVLFHEDISSRIASTRADRPDEFPNLNDNIWSQLVQLHPKLMQDFCQHQVLRHTKPDQKQIFKHHNFIRPRCGNSL